MKVFTLVSLVIILILISEFAVTKNTTKRRKKNTPKVEQIEKSSPRKPKRVTPVSIN